MITSKSGTQPRSSDRVWDDMDPQFKSDRDLFFSQGKFPVSNLLPAYSRHIDFVRFVSIARTFFAVKAM